MTAWNLLLMLSLLPASLGPVPPLLPEAGLLPAAEEDAPEAEPTPPPPAPTTHATPEVDAPTGDADEAAAASGAETAVDAADARLDEAAPPSAAAAGAPATAAPEDDARPGEGTTPQSAPKRGAPLPAVVLALAALAGLAVLLRRKSP